MSNRRQCHHPNRRSVRHTTQRRCQNLQSLAPHSARPIHEDTLNDQIGRGTEELYGCLEQLHRTVARGHKLGRLSQQCSREQIVEIAIRFWTPLNKSERYGVANILLEAGIVGTGCVELLVAYLGEVIAQLSLGRLSSSLVRDPSTYVLIQGGDGFVGESGVFRDELAVRRWRENTIVEWPGRCQPNATPSHHRLVWSKSEISRHRAMIDDGLALEGAVISVVFAGDNDGIQIFALGAVPVSKHEISISGVSLDCPLGRAIDGARVGQTCSYASHDGKIVTVTLVGTSSALLR